MVCYGVMGTRACQMDEAVWCIVLCYDQLAWRGVCTVSPHELQHIIGASIFSTIQDWEVDLEEFQEDV